MTTRTTDQRPPLPERPQWARLLRLLLLLNLIVGAGLTSRRVASADEPPAEISRIAFGSCAKQDWEQPIWNAVLAARPDVFIWLGDNIYGDSRDPDVLAAKWQQLASQPGYQALVRQTQIVGTWDDHDYGENDAGREFPLKAESQKLLLDFLGEPVDSPRRQQQGVYSAVEWGPPERRIQLILLDTRYHRSPLKLNGIERVPGQPYPGPYAPTDDPDATLLGAEQWTWLGQQLERPAKLRLIASSIQVLNDSHSWEKWGNFPAEQQRLWKLIRDTGAEGVIMLSGDRHHAEFSRATDLFEYPLWDLTSSSLNSPTASRIETNPLRVGPLYLRENFGLLTIDWTAADPMIRCEIQGLRGEVILEQTIPLSDLRPN